MASTPVQLPSILGSLKAPAGTNPQDAQSVSDQMTMQFAPQESSISSTINQIQGFLDRDIQAQQNYGTIADSKIAQIGSELATKLQGNVGAIGGIFDKGVQQVGSSYDQGIASNREAGNAVINRVTESANQLGQGHALKADAYGNDPVSRLMATQATNESRLQTSKAGSTANLASLGTALTGIAQKTVGDSERDYGQKRADVATQVLKVIGQLQSTANTSIMEQLKKFSDLATVAAPTFRTLLTAATTARTTAEQKAANDAFEQALKIGKFNQDQQKIDQENDPNSIDNLIKMNTLAKGSKELGREDVNYISNSEGANNLTSFLEQTRRTGGGGPSGLSGTAVVGIQNFIDQNMGSSKMSGIYNTADAAAILGSIAQSSAKNGLVELPISPGSKYTNRSKGDYVVDLPTLLRAIDARFTNVGPAAKTGTKI